MVKRRIARIVARQKRFLNLEKSYVSKYKKYILRRLEGRHKDTPYRRRTGHRRAVCWGTFLCCSALIAAYADCWLEERISL